MLDKTKINFLIDALMFLCMMAIAGLGFLMKFVLPPGRERVAKYGNVGVSLFGMDRHEWGTIHLYLAFFLLALLAVHVVLHWKMILTLFAKLLPDARARRIAASSFIGVSAFLIVVPFLVKPEISSLSEAELAAGGEGCLIEAGEEVTICTGCDEVAPSAKAGKFVPVSGETIREICEKHGMPPHFLKRSLGIPESVSDETSFSDLLKGYQFQMKDVERVLANYTEVRRRQFGGPEHAGQR